MKRVRYGRFAWLAVLASAALIASPAQAQEPDEPPAQEETLASKLLREVLIMAGRDPDEADAFQPYSTEEETQTLFARLAGAAGVSAPDPSGGGGGGVGIEGALYSTWDGSVPEAWPRETLETKELTFTTPGANDGDLETGRVQTGGSIGPDGLEARWELESSSTKSGDAFRQTQSYEVKGGVCPDAQGLIRGEYKSQLVVTRQSFRADAAMAFKYLVQVDNDAEIQSVTISHIAGTYVASGAGIAGSVTVRGGSIPAQPWNDRQLSDKNVEMTKTTTGLTGGRRAFGEDTFDLSVYQGMLEVHRAIRHARQIWQGGRCVAVTWTSDKKTLQPKESANIAVDAVHVIEGGRPSGAKVRAITINGSLTPEPNAKRDPEAKYTYTAGEGGSNSVSLSALSRRGSDYNGIYFGEPRYILIDVELTTDAVKLDGPAIRYDGPISRHRVVLDGAVVRVSSEAGQDRWEGELRARGRGNINWPDVSKLSNVPAFDNTSLVLNNTPRCDTPWTGHQRYKLTVTMDTPNQVHVRSPSGTPEAEFFLEPLSAAHYTANNCNPGEMDSVTRNGRVLPSEIGFLDIPADHGGVNFGSAFKFRWPLNIEATHTFDQSVPDLGSVKQIVKVQMARSPIPAPNP